MLDLLDYRRRVAEMYRVVCQLGTDAPEAHTRFRRTWDELFHSHPHSPLDEQQKTKSSSTSTTPITPRAITIPDGYVLWHRRRTLSIFQYRPVRCCGKLIGYDS
jgi:hypothetical protein